MHFMSLVLVLTLSQKRVGKQATCRMTLRSCFKWIHLARAGAGAGTDLCANPTPFVIGFTRIERIFGPNRIAFGAAVTLSQSRGMESCVNLPI